MPDATLFQVETAPKWAKNIIRLLSIDYQAIPQDFDDVENTLQTIERYTLISGRLYRLGEDNVLRVCTEPDDAKEVISEAHVTIGGNHASRDKIELYIRCNGFWWPSLTRDVAKYI